MREGLRGPRYGGKALLAEPRTALCCLEGSGASNGWVLDWNCPPGPFAHLSRSGGACRLQECDGASG